MNHWWKEYKKCWRSYCSYIHKKGEGHRCIPPSTKVNNYNRNLPWVNNGEDIFFLNFSGMVEYAKLCGFDEPKLSDLNDIVLQELHDIHEAAHHVNPGTLECFQEVLNFKKSNPKALDLPEDFKYWPPEYTEGDLKYFVLCKPEIIFKILHSYFCLHGALEKISEGVDGNNPGEFAEKALRNYGVKEWKTLKI